jgi:hypothetical protein
VRTLQPWRRTTKKWECPKTAASKKAMLGCLSFACPGASKIETQFQHQLPKEPDRNGKYTCYKCGRSTVKSSVARFAKTLCYGEKASTRADAIKATREVKGLGPTKILSATDVNKMGVYKHADFSMNVSASAKTDRPLRGGGSVPKQMLPREHCDIPAKTMHGPHARLSMSNEILPKFAQTSVPISYFCDSYRPCNDPCFPIGYKRHFSGSFAPEPMYSFDTMQTHEVNCFTRPACVPSTQNSICTYQCLTSAPSRVPNCYDCELASTPPFWPHCRSTPVAVSLAARLRQSFLMQSSCQDSMMPRTCLGTTDSHVRPQPQWQPPWPD